METSRILSEERYRKLLENINDSVTVIDALGTTIWTSATARRDLGYEAHFWQSENLINLVHPEDIVAIQGLLGRILDCPDSPLKGEVRLRQTDGSYADVGFTAVNLIGDPDIEGIVITARSIESEVREREHRATTEAGLRLAADDQAMFITSISHEMRSPLHAVLGLSEILVRTPDLPAESIRHIESITKSATALRLMIDDLLDFSKMSAGHMELVAEPFSPGSVADDALESLRPAAEVKGLEYLGTIAPEVPRVVVGDPHRLRQLLVNLLSNAVKYTARGTVDLTVKANANGSIRFSIADTGQGIPPEAIPTLFDPYRQARREDSNKGTGLGLTISRQLANLMGGTLELRTGETGTTFWCDLNFTKARRASDHPHQPAVEQTGSGVVLVVDDSPVNLMLSSAQLERLGYVALTADSGQAALDLLSAHYASSDPIDLVLMDWHMPEMDGLETTARIREVELSDERKPTPIVAMTASVISGDRERCIEAGMDDYLPKPVSIDELGEKLSQWLLSPNSSKTQSNLAGIGGIEQKKLDRLISDLGNKVIVATVIGTFLVELPKWTSELLSCIKQLDIDGVRRTAHTIKSSAALLGATELSDTCVTLEAFESINDSTLQAEADRFEQNVAEAIAGLVAAKAELEA